MGHTRAYLVVAALLLAGVTTAFAKIPPCPGGRYLVVGGPLAHGSEDAIDTVALAGKTISISSGCGPVKGTGGGTKVTAKWKSCAGLAGVAKLKGMISEHCRTLSATFSVKAMKMTKPVIAGLSTCGDDIWDPEGGEECDGNLGTCGGLC